jgi:hypothetical protein
MELGKSFSIWKGAHEKGPCLSKAVDSYDEYVSHYLTNVTSGQLTDGLDEFYKDYRNRSITVPKAVWPVLKSIAGDRKDQIEELTVNLRKDAAR